MTESLACTQLLQLLVISSSKKNSIAFLHNILILNNNRVHDRRWDVIWGYL